ncbi:tRNA pseudouridine(38-40) synthase TruA [Saccharicrinis sp. FJH2]|uniref:tRNA pseudouridine(38-40) synthase TruA n=1 Tax=Saccharicrinis sp. FJH65 TaxID=3344659 RepID=UPI0035F47BBF
MKRRYFFKISFKGTAFHGWQKQHGVQSVQETIEMALSNVLKQEVYIAGCGRTDAGVHASQYYFHLDFNEELQPDFLFVINKELPEDISVHKIFEAERNLHAQFSAIQRTYTYKIHTAKNPFLSELSAYYPLENFNVSEVRKAVKLLTGMLNFKAFCITPAKHSNTVCTIYSASFTEDPGLNAYVFRISADHFLRGMIRIIVGKLIEIGSGRMTVAELEHHLNTGERFKFMNQAYPQGLYLSEIKYESE